jgi:hypothetical protein
MQEFSQLKNVTLEESCYAFAGILLKSKKDSYGMTSQKVTFQMAKRILYFQTQSGRLGYACPFRFASISS